MISINSSRLQGLLMPPCPMEITFPNPYTSPPSPSHPLPIQQTDFQAIGSVPPPYPNLLSPLLGLPSIIPHHWSFSSMSSDSAEVAPLPRHEQKELEQLCLWATVSAGWSFSSIKNPEDVEYIVCLNPSFKLTGCNKIY